MLDYLVITWTLILLASVAHGILAGRDLSDIAYESRFLLFVPVYFLYANIIEKRTNIRFHLITLVCIGIFLIVVTSISVVNTTFFVRVGGQTRLVMGEHGFYFCMMATLFFSLALHDSKRVLIYLLGFFLSIAMVVISYQRASYVQLFFCLFLLGMLIEGKRRKYFVLSIGIGAVLLLPMFLFLGPVPDLLCKGLWRASVQHPCGDRGSVHNRKIHRIRALVCPNKSTSHNRHGNGNCDQLYTSDGFWPCTDQTDCSA